MTPNFYTILPSRGENEIKTNRGFCNIISVSHVGYFTAVANSMGTTKMRLTFSISQYVSSGLQIFFFLLRSLSAQLLLLANVELYVWTCQCISISFLSTYYTHRDVHGYRCTRVGVVGPVWHTSSPSHLRSDTDTLTLSHAGRWVWPGTEWRSPHTRSQSALPWSNRLLYYTHTYTCTSSQMSPSELSYHYNLYSMHN